MSSHFKALFAVFLLMLLGYGGYFFFFTPSSVKPVEAVTVKNLEENGLPSVEFHNFFNSSVISSESLKGSVVIVNFWASWCAPCVEEVPSLIKLINKYNGKVKLLAISGDSSKQDIEIFLKSFPGLKAENITVVWDENRSLMKMFSIARLPESYIFSQDLKLQKKVVGTIDWYTEDAQKYIETLFSK